MSRLKLTRGFSPYVVLIALFSSSAAAEEGTADSFAAQAVIEWDAAALLAAEAVSATSLAATAQDDEDVAPAPERFSSESIRLERFGDQGTWQFNILATGAWAESGSDFAGGGIGADYFIWDNFSAGAQLLGLNFHQEGPDTWGASFDVILRWHFLNEDTWSLYVDGGAGILKTSDDVPSDGWNFNFTPQIGVGMTFEIGGQARAMAGVRWHHISNAEASDSNPGRDSLQIYGGVTFPF